MVNNGRSRRNSRRSVAGDVDRRSFLKATGAGATGVALAGCLGGDDEEEAEGLTVGHLAPMSLPLGVGSIRSAQMAADEINDDGGVNGEDVEILEGDTEGLPSEAQSVAEEFIQQENVDILVGGFASEASLALVDLTAEMDVPFLITGSASPQLTRDHAGQDYDTYKNIFRVGPINSDLQAEALTGYCEYLRDHHGWDNVAFIYDNAEWTTAFEELIPGYLEDQGIDVVYDSALSIEDPDLETVLDEVSNTEADYVLRFFAHIDGSPMLAAWHEGEYEFGIEGIHVTGMFPGYFEASQGIALYESTAQTAAGGVSAITDATLPFVESYREQFGDSDTPPFQAPMYMGFNTYDAIHIAAGVVNETGTQPPSDLDGFVEGMLDVQHEGAAGPQEFYGPDSDYPHDLVEVRNDEGDVENFPVTQWQQDGALECVYPEVFRTEEHVAPHWM